MKIRLYFLLLASLLVVLPSMALNAKEVKLTKEEKTALKVEKKELKTILKEEKKALKNSSGTVGYANLKGNIIGAKVSFYEINLDGVKTLLSTDTLTGLTGEFTIPTNLITNTSLYLVELEGGSVDGIVKNGKLRALYKRDWLLNTAFTPKVNIITELFYELTLNTVQYDMTNFETKANDYVQKLIISQDINGDEVIDSKDIADFDSTFMANLKFDATHGLYEDEKTVSQSFEIDIEVSYERQKSCNDSIENSINEINFFFKNNEIVG